MQSPSWEANWFAASQEIPRILWNPKVHYRTHKRPSPVPILGQPNPVHIPTSHLLQIHPNIIHPSTPRSPQWSPSLRFPHQDPIRPPLLAHTRHMPSPSHSSRFYHPHNIGWGVPIILLFSYFIYIRIYSFIHLHFDTVSKPDYRISNYYTNVNYEWIWKNAAVSKYKTESRNLPAETQAKCEKGHSRALGVPVEIRTCFPPQEQKTEALLLVPSETPNHTHFAAVSSPRLDISQIRPVPWVETSETKFPVTKVTFQNKEHFSPSIQRLLRDLGRQYAYYVVKSSYIWRDEMRTVMHVFFDVTLFYQARKEQSIVSDFLWPKEKWAEQRRVAITLFTYLCRGYTFVCFVLLFSIASQNTNSVFDLLWEVCLLRYKGWISNI